MSRILSGSRKPRKCGMRTETAPPVSFSSEGSLRTIRRQRRVMRGQSAETVGFNLKRTIESRAHVLERDSRGQIDDLLGVEVAVEFVEDFVGNVDRAERHLLGIAERG